MLPESDSDEEGPLGSKGKERETGDQRSNQAFGAPISSFHSPFSDETPAPISRPMAHNSGYRREDHNQNPFLNIPPPLSLDSFGSSSSSSSSSSSFGSSSSSSSSSSSFGSSSSPFASEEDKAQKWNRNLAPLSDPRQSVFQGAEKSAGESMLEGASRLREQEPGWITSSIDDDGLPRLKSRTQKGGYPLDEKDVERYGAKNDFASWLRGEAPLPEKEAQMNCWEAVCTSACLGGLVTRGQLVALFESTENAQNRTKALLDRLGREDAKPVDKETIPEPGHIIVMDTDDDAGFHVFIAGGGKKDRVYSHDKSDARRNRKYNKREGLLGPFNQSGSTESMVYRSRVHVSEYIETTFRQQDKGAIEIRYLSPEVFRRLPGKAAKRPLG